MYMYCGSPCVAVCVSVRVASAECQLNKMKASPYTLIAHMDAQPVRGCISTGMKNVLDRYW